MSFKLRPSFLIPLVFYHSYGRTSARSPSLFGISLYQQKALELHPSGRRLFDARDTLAAAGFPQPDTPYLSQIPCSWGALYFPEHWREFHEYLAARLSDPASSPDVHVLAPFARETAVVPAVRSNRWTRSWKRFFIELAYLRGYTMLYPNFPTGLSLSTNHLEAGAHVRPTPGADMDAHERRKRLFNVPLMVLPDADGAFTHDAEREAVLKTGLLNMPGNVLPQWSELPVLDLLGELVNYETIIRRGVTRRTELTGCTDVPSRPYDIGDLLCVQDE